MKLAITGDLHWGMSPKGDAATEALLQRVVELQPEALVLAGDIGEDDQFAAGLQRFQGLPGVKLLVPGNHDLWTRASSPASLELYDERLPAIAAEHGFHYLDHAPYLSAGGAEAIVGNINWYDYSFADPDLEREIPDVRKMYQAKRFPHGQHNDGRFIRLGMSDAAFTRRVVERFREQLHGLPASVERVTVIQHHPPVRELFYPTPLVTVDQRVWLAYTGNRRMQDLVLKEPRVRHIVCGHTHAACEADILGKRCLNIGGDYNWKRLLLLDTATGEEQAWEFGREGRESAR